MRARPGLDSTRSAETPKSLSLTDFIDPKIDSAFTNFRDVDAGLQWADMTWDDVPMTSSGLATGSNGNSIQGKFYGLNHGEACAGFG
ncbi:MAG: hypothetical protein OXL68_03360 [Paracoccaceae bacterium]|nr:hypothetical protein [Paracoccaceae bacterium]